MSRCADPYGCGCTRKDVVVMMRVNGFVDGRNPLDPDDFVDVDATIGLCPDCMWWECDHDWDAEPKGPALYVKHMRDGSYVKVRQRERKLFTQPDYEASGLH